MPLKSTGPLEATASPSQLRGSGTFPLLGQLGSRAATGASQHPLPRARPVPGSPPGGSAPAASSEPTQPCGPRALRPPPGTGQPRDGIGRAPALPYLGLVPPLPSAAGEARRGRGAATRCPAPAPLSMAPRAGAGSLRRRRPAGAAGRRERRRAPPGPARMLAAPRACAAATAAARGGLAWAAAGAHGGGGAVSAPVAPGDAAGERSPEQPLAEPPEPQAVRPHAAPCTAPQPLPQARRLPAMAVPPGTCCSAGSVTLPGTE